MCIFQMEFEPTLGDSLLFLTRQCALCGGFHILSLSHEAECALCGGFHILRLHPLTPVAPLPLHLA